MFYIGALSCGFQSLAAWLSILDNRAPLTCTRSQVFPLCSNQPTRHHRWWDHSPVTGKRTEQTTWKYASKPQNLQAWIGLYYRPPVYLSEDQYSKRSPLNFNVNIIHFNWIPRIYYLYSWCGKLTDICCEVKYSIKIVYVN